MGLRRSRSATAVLQVGVVLVRRGAGALGNLSVHHRARFRRRAGRAADAPDKPQLPAHLVQVTADGVVAAVRARPSNRSRPRRTRRGGRQRRRERRDRSAARRGRRRAVGCAGRRRRVRRGARRAVATRRAKHRSASVARQLDMLDAGVTCRIRSTLICGDEIIELQTDIESRFARHRGSIDGGSVDDNADPRRAPHERRQRAREAAWEASKSVGAEVAADVRELARLRNRAARSLGYRDHFALTLATTDFDEDRLFATLAEVDVAHRRAVPRPEGASSTGRSATAFGVVGRRAAAVALRRSVLSGRA